MVVDVLGVAVFACSRFVRHPDTDEDDTLVIELQLKHQSTSLYFLNEIKSACWVLLIIVNCLSYVFEFKLSKLTSGVFFYKNKYNIFNDFIHVLGLTILLAIVELTHRVYR